MALIAGRVYGRAKRAPPFAIDELAGREVDQPLLEGSGEPLIGVVVSSGPVLLDYHADGSLTEIDYGRQFERPPGRLLLTTGRVVWEFAASGNFVSYTQRGGTTQNVCSILR